MLTDHCCLCVCRSDYLTLIIFTRRTADEDDWMGVGASYTVSRTEEGYVDEPDCE